MCDPKLEYMYHKLEMGKLGNNKEKIRLKLSTLIKYLNLELTPTVLIAINRVH